MTRFEQEGSEESEKVKGGGFVFGRGHGVSLGVRRAADVDGACHRNEHRVSRNASRMES